MSQHDYVIANGTGAAVRSDLNGALGAIVTQNSGSTEPATTYAFMPWADTTAGVMKMRNSSNSGWISLFQLDGEWTSIAFENGSAAAPSIYFKDSGTDTGVYSPGTDQVGITTGGTVRLTTSTTAFTGTLPWRGQDGTAAAPAVSFNSDTDTGIYNIGANQLGIATNGVERVNVGTTEVVWNDSGADIDFRVEGDTKANLFKIDAGTDTVSVDGTFATGNVNYPTEGSLSGRNRIINGDMRIDQRNAGASVTPSSSTSQYLVDRWKIDYSQTSKITAQRDTVVPAGFTNSLKLTVASAVTAGASDYFLLSQPIEGVNGDDLAFGSASAKSITISFQVRSSVTGTYAVAVRNSANNRSYVGTYSISAANTFEAKTVTLTGDTSGTWLTDTGIGLNVIFDLGSGSNFNGTAGAWAGANNFRTSSTANWIANAGATFYITGVQLEAGSVATPFERRSYGQELALCQRYYQRIQGDTSNQRSVGNGLVGTTSAIYRVLIPAKVQMRAAPTLSSSGLTGYDVGVNTAISVGTNYSTGDQISADFTGGSGFITGRPAVILTGSVSTSYFDASAEL